MRVKINISFATERLIFLANFLACNWKTNFLPDRTLSHTSRLKQWKIIFFVYFVFLILSVKYGISCVYKIVAYTLLKQIAFITLLLAFMVNKTFHTQGSKRRKTDKWIQGMWTMEFFKRTDCSFFYHKILILCDHII